MKNKRGITIIALIITIIIMLILVGVTVSITMNSGLFNIARESKDKTNTELKKEELMSIVVGSLDNNGNLTIDNLKTQLQNSGVTIIGTEFPLEIVYKEEKFKIEENGEIKEILEKRVYLYNKGNTYNDLTGGFIISKNSYGEKEIIVNETDVYMRTKNSSNYGDYGAHAAYITNNKIDITNYSKIVAIYNDVTITNCNSEVTGAGVCLKVDKQWGASDDGYSIATGYKTGNCKLELDISNAEGSYYIGACVNSLAKKIKESTCKLSQLWLEE